MVPGLLGDLLVPGSGMNMIQCSLLLSLVGVGVMPFVILPCFLLFTALLQVLQLFGAMAEILVGCFDFPIWVDRLRSLVPRFSGRINLLSSPVLLNQDLRLGPSILEVLERQVDRRRSQRHRGGLAAATS